VRRTGYTAAWPHSGPERPIGTREKGPWYGARVAKNTYNGAGGVGVGFGSEGVAAGAKACGSRRERESASWLQGPPRTPCAAPLITVSVWGLAAQREPNPVHKTGNCASLVSLLMTLALGGSAGGFVFGGKSRALCFKTSREVLLRKINKFIRVCKNALDQILSAPHAAQTRSPRARCAFAC